LPEGRETMTQFGGDEIKSQQEKKGEEGKEISANKWGAVSNRLSKRRKKKTDNRAIFKGPYKEGV